MSHPHLWDRTLTHSEAGQLVLANSSSELKGTSVSRTLEIEFCDELNQTRSCCTDDVAKILGVVHLAVNGSGTIELTVVESVKCFCPKLQGSRFGQVHILLKRQIEIIDAWPIEDTTLGVA
jgi:hypothetical protein